MTYEVPRKEAEGSKELRGVAALTALRDRFGRGAYRTFGMDAARSGMDDAAGFRRALERVL